MFTIHGLHVVQKTTRKVLKMHKKVLIGTALSIFLYMAYAVNEDRKIINFKQGCLEEKLEVAKLPNGNIGCRKDDKIVRTMF